MKKAVIVLADGFEEIEAITPIDVLRRAGVQVTVAGLGGMKIRGSHDIAVVCDVEFGDVSGYDALVFPGGLPGAENLAASESVMSAIDYMNSRGGIIAAICASPAYVLAPSGVLDDRKATCYPGCEKGRFTEAIEQVNSRVVQDGNLITSQGPGTALEFALKLVEALVDRDKASQLRSGMIASC